MEGHGQFHHPKVGAQVPSSAADVMDKEAADVLTRFHKLCMRHRPQPRGIRSGIKHGLAQ
jgi:hypothetical protein